MVDLLSLVEADLGAAHKVKGNNHWWACPFHDDRNPSFAVKVDDGQQFYKCFSCGAAGDDVTWLTEYRKLPIADAMRLARGDGQQPKATGQKRKAERPALPDAPPDDAWQRAALAAVDAASACLAAPEGQAARDYLHWRGLSDETIDAARLGYNASWLEVQPGCWLAPGVTIPCFADGRLWYVQVRTTDAARAASKKGLDKYHSLKGSKLKALYGTDKLLSAKVAYVTEGEFDALLLGQYLPDSAAAVTMGSAGSLPNNPSWLRYFAAVKRVLLIMDNDAAGRKAVQNWRQFLALVNVLPVPGVPGGKDVTDYWQAGGDVKRWARPGRYIFPADCRLPFPAGAWRRLADGRIEARLLLDDLQTVLVGNWRALLHA